MCLCVHVYVFCVCTRMYMCVCKCMCVCVYVCVHNIMCARVWSHCVCVCLIYIALVMWQSLHIVLYIHHFCCKAFEGIKRAGSPSKNKSNESMISDCSSWSNHLIKGKTYTYICICSITVIACMLLLLQFLIVRDVCMSCGLNYYRMICRYQ